MEAQVKEQEMQLKDQMNQRDNETKILIATMSNKENDGIEEQTFSEEARAKLMQQMKEFDAKISLEKEKLEEQKRKNRADESLRAKQINKVRSTSK